MAEPRLVYIHAIGRSGPGGAAFVAARLLSGFPYEVVTLTNRLLRRTRGASERVLPGRHHLFTKVPPAPARLPGWANLAIGLANLPLAVITGVRAAILARRRRAAWVLSVVDEGFCVIAGALAARVARLPHLIWAFDLWEENSHSGFQRWLARRLERPIWRRAAAIVVHAPTAAKFYREKHGARCHVFPTPVDVDESKRHGDRNLVALERSGRPAEVLVAGAVYWAQEDAVRRLTRVCGRMPDVATTIMAFPHLLRARNLGFDRVENPLPPNAVAARLERADVLFLGLAFGTEHPALIQTATPARLPEYMASGTPILVHAPAGSHVTEYARAEDFAEVVDEPDDDALARGLRRLLDDRNLSELRARRARELALHRHAADAVRERFIQLLLQVRKGSRFPDTGSASGNRGLSASD